jgi:hypothetical protein
MLFRVPRVHALPGSTRSVDCMTQKPEPSEEDEVDLDRLAIEQMANDEPDELDGPAWDLDRTLDDANPDPRQ